jgi:hypothetical protein
MVLILESHWVVIIIKILEYWLTTLEALKNENDSSDEPSLNSEHSIQPEKHLVIFKVTLIFCIQSLDYIEVRTKIFVKKLNYKED